MKYSIVIPAYKEVYFQECLESVLNIKYDDYEVVVLNDCSPENIKGIVEQCRLLKHGEKIRYYENEYNIGSVNVVKNWNKLLSLAIGEYIACIGDDDKVAPEFFEEYDRMMERFTDLDVYHARTYIINEQSEIINVQEDRPDWESDYSIIWHAFMAKRIQFIGDYLFKRETLLKNKGFYNLPMARGSDWVTAIIMAKERGIVNGHIPVFYYRDNSFSITTNTKGEVLIDADIKFREWILNYLQKEPIEQLKQIYRNILIRTIPKQLQKINQRTISRDIGYSFMRKWFYWFRKHKMYGISTFQYIKITGWALLYMSKRIITRK